LERYLRRCEEASPVLEAFNALPDRARHTVWHQAVEGDPDPAGEAEARLLWNRSLRHYTGVNG
jgi:hypothetical protein